LPQGASDVVTPLVLTTTIINILQHLQSDRRSGASTKLFLNLLIQFYLNNVKNLHQFAQNDIIRTTWRSHSPYVGIGREKMEEDKPTSPSTVRVRSGSPSCENC